MQIAVTGASGKTGQAVVDGLRRAGHAPISLVRRADAAAQARNRGLQARTVHFEDPESLVAAFRGVRAVYHVPPNMHPTEDALGERVIAAASEAGVERFVLHSVLHPYAPSMPHHLRKARTELTLRTSALDWTILQPASYIQNLLPFVDAARNEGRYRIPYAATTPFSPVDLDDVADVAAVVLERDDTVYGTYELCGPERLDSHAMATILGDVVGRSVIAESTGVAAWRAEAERAERPAHEIDDLAAMFAWYDEHGLPGSDLALRTLLGRRPTDATSALIRDLNRSTT